MSRRSPDEVYATLIAAGWPPDAAVTMTAIAGAESGWDDTATGDVGLQNAQWGPSFGLFQIRTLKSQTGSGGDRDINRLAGSDLEQARAAYVISSGGRDFSPWSVYNTGAYQAHLAAANRAAELVDDDGGGPLPGPEWLPWNLPATVGREAGEAVADTLGLGGARHIVIEGLAVVAGLAVVVAGLVLLSTRTVKKVLAPARRAVWGS